MLKGRGGNTALAGFLEQSHSGEVVGAFSSGIYFSLGEKLLLLHDAEYGVLPFGLCIEGLSGTAKNLGLEPGMKLAYNSGVLKCRETGFELCIDFFNEKENPAKVSDIEAFAEKSLKLLETEGRSSLHIFSDCEYEKLEKSEIDDIFAATAFNAMLRLKVAMDKADGEQFEEILSKLIGLGRGLTPSLDDFITGAVYVFRYAERVWQLRVSFLEEMCKALERIVPIRTNVYSAAYILSAARGEDFSLMRHCLENAGNSGFAASAARLLAVGGSSGADMLSGMCFASNYILKQRLFTL